MIKPEQIPTEVLAVFRKACDSGDPWSEPWNIADTIAAAINAWPGMEIEMVLMDEDYLILPLPMETANATIHQTNERIGVEKVLFINPEENR